MPRYSGATTTPNADQPALESGADLVELAVTVGFEPTVGVEPTQHFECCTFGRSDTSPRTSLRHSGDAANPCRRHPTPPRGPPDSELPRSSRCAAGEHAPVPTSSPPEASAAGISGSGIRSSTVERPRGCRRGPLPGSSHERDRELQTDGRGSGSVGASVAYAALIRGSARHVALYDIRRREGGGGGARTRPRHPVHRFERHHRRLRCRGGRGLARGRHHRRREAESGTDPHRAGGDERAHHPRHDAEAPGGGPERRLRHRDQPVRRADGARAGGDRTADPTHLRSGTVLDHLAPAVEDRATAGVATRACTPGSSASTETPSSPCGRRRPSGRCPSRSSSSRRLPLRPGRIGCRVRRRRDAAYKVIRARAPPNYAIGLSSGASSRPSPRRARDPAREHRAARLPRHRRDWPCPSPRSSAPPGPSRLRHTSFSEGEPRCSAAPPRTLTGVVDSSRV